MGYNIPALEKLIDEFRKMPSVGTKSAERMAFYVLGLDDNGTAELANAIVTAHEKIHQCKICRNLTEDEICPICSNEKRDRSTICVVESPRDVIAFELLTNTAVCISSARRYFADERYRPRRPHR